jgi:hypothetical protein
MREILQLDVVVDLNRAQTEYESKWLENPAESNDFPDELSEKIRASAQGDCAMLGNMRNLGIAF